MIFVLYTFLVDCAHLAMTPLSSRAKVQIFTFYLLNTVLLPFANLFNINKINFLGFTMEGFQFKTLHFLLGEIFVRNEYFFRSKEVIPTIIDCGAEVGFTVAYFKYLFPKSKIVAFEPDPDNYRLLLKNIQRNRFSSVTAINQAVSAKAGQFRFFTSNRPGSLRGSLNKDRESDREVSVKTVKLANFIKGKSVSYLKIDIEGHETIVLDNLVRSKAIKNIKQIGVEYHHHITPSDPSQFSQFLSLLENSGFKYQLSTRSVPSINTFQDIMVSAYRSE